VRLDKLTPDSAVLRPLRSKLSGMLNEPPPAASIDVRFWEWNGRDETPLGPVRHGQEP